MMAPRRSALLVLAAAAALPSFAAGTARRSSLVETYSGAAGRILGAELVAGQAYVILQHLTDRVGPRLSGALDLVPRRTIRGVLYMNEENGLRGARAYADAHRDELSRHVAAIESDSGAGRPTGFVALAGPGGVELLQDLASLLSSVGADQVSAGGGGGADISALRPAGVPLLGLRQDVTHYFDWHHTAADTLDKVDSLALAQNAAALAVMAYVLADMPEPLPRPEPAASTPR